MSSEIRSAPIEMQSGLVRAIAEELTSVANNLGDVEDVILAQMSSAGANREKHSLQSLDLAVQILDDLRRLLHRLADSSPDEPASERELFNTLMLEQCRRRLFPSLCIEDFGEEMSGEQVQLFDELPPSSRPTSRKCRS